MKVAGIIVNLVPYHHARWEAFTRLSRAECHLLEFTDQDAFKVLEYSASASYQRHTLFPRDGGEAVSASSLCRAMSAKLDVLKPEAVCVSGWALPVSLAALEWSARNRVPAVILSESNEFDEARSAAKEFIKRRIIALCSASLAGGTPQADYLVKLGLSRESIFLGYDSVDNDYFAAGAAAARIEALRTPHSALRTHLGLPENYFLACCRFGQKKNLPRLIEAYARYRQLALQAPLRAGERVAGRPGEVVGSSHSPLATHHSPPWNLVLLGDGPLRESLYSQLSTLNLHEHVHLPGAKPYSEIPAYYGLAKALIHASTTEQWGLVVNEAMASGLPVLVSNRCGCAADLVHEGVNGFTFDPYNIEKIAQRMFQLSTLNSQPSTDEVGRVTPCAPPSSPEPSTLNPQPPAAPKCDAGGSTTLAHMSAASQRIISNWSPERFASGLKAAVMCALKIGPKRASLLDRLLLKIMLRRQLPG